MKSHTPYDATVSARQSAATPARSSQNADARSPAEADLHGSARQVSQRHRIQHLFGDAAQCMGKVEQPDAFAPAQQSAEEPSRTGIDRMDLRSPPSGSQAVQRVVYPNMGAMWAAVHPAYALANIQQDSVLEALYDDAAAQLANCDFVQVPGTAPQASSTPLMPQPFRIDWDTAANLGLDNDYFASAIIHELAHAASSQQYRRNGVNNGELVWANMNLPPAVGVINPVTGMAPNQQASYVNQMQTLDRNWLDLDGEAQADQASGALTAGHYGHIDSRIQYALTTAFVHNDTVLGDMLYYLMAKNLQGTRTYAFARRMLKEANDRRRNGFWSTAHEEVRIVDSRAKWYELAKW